MFSMWLPFLLIRLIGCTIIQEQTKCLIYQYVILHKLHWTKPCTLKQMRCDSRHLTMRFPDLSHFTTRILPAWQSDRMAFWRYTPKVGSWKLYCVRMWCIPSSSRIKSTPCIISCYVILCSPRELHGSGNYGLQGEGSVLIITSSDPFGIFVLPIPTVL